jgi:hypothetical protein
MPSYQWVTIGQTDKSRRVNRAWFFARWQIAVLRSDQNRRMYNGAGMSHWQDRFLGIGELPPLLSILEIEFFQFSSQESWSVVIVDLQCAYALGGK